VTIKSVPTHMLRTTNVVQDRNKRVLIVFSVQECTVPGTQERGFLVVLSDPRSGQSVQHTASSQTRWVVFSS